MADEHKVTKKIHPNGRTKRAEIEPFPLDHPGVPERLWEPFPTETAQAYHAFEHYMKHPAYVGSYDDHMNDCPNAKGSRQTWLNWTRRWRWMERREAYLSFLAVGHI